MRTQKKKIGRGGPRPNSGRPPKEDKDLYQQLNLILRKDTIARLKAGAGSKFVSKFLQFHLDHFPPLSHEEYLSVRDRKPLVEVGPRGRRREVIVMTRLEKPKRKSKPPTEAELAFDAALAKTAQEMGLFQNRGTPQS